eukprot:s4186_g5.t1
MASSKGAKGERMELTGPDRGQDPKGSGAKSRTGSGSSNSGRVRSVYGRSTCCGGNSGRPTAPPAPEPDSVPSSALETGATPDAPDVPQTNLWVEEVQEEARVDPPTDTRLGGRRAALEADERAPVKLVPKADRASSRAAKKRAVY